MLINIPNEQAEVLQTLKQEMLTQDTCCQADPRFWMISEETIEYGVDEEHADVFYLVDKDGNIVGKKIEDYFDVITALEDEILEDREACNMILKIVDGKHLDVHIDYDDESYDDERIDDAEDAATFLNESGFEYSLCGIRFDTMIVRGPLFLTKKACVDHITKYGYLYRNPKPYAMTAHRSPEIEFLWGLIEKTEWSSACETAKDADDNISPAEQPMLAVEYLREKNRMKEHLLRVCDGLISCSRVNCDKCRFSALHRVPNAEQEANDPEQAVVTVQHWAFEHPSYGNRE